MNSVSFGDKVRIVVIHPRWAIDEKAIIFRNCVWFNPPHPPRKVDVNPSNNSSSVFRCWDVIIRMVSGASFCQVVSSSAVIVVDPCSTSGSQRWNGASPSFMAKATVNSMHDVLLCRSVISH